MSFRAISTIFGFVIGLTATALAGQQPVIDGPILGFITDNAGSTIWPIAGIPGASIRGERLELPAGIESAVVSPNQNYAVARRSEGLSPVVIDFTTGVPALSGFDGIRPGSGLIAISPTGSSVAFYHHEARSIQVIRGLPHKAEILTELSASLVPGRATGLALSDDGTVAVLLVSDDNGQGLWAVDSSGRVRQMLIDRPSAVAFLPGSRNIVVADIATRGAFLIIAPDAEATPTILGFAPDGVAHFSSIAVSQDGRRVFLADNISGAIMIVDMETLRSALVFCSCRPADLQQLNGISVFSLTDSPDAPVMILDASSPEPRIVIAPPGKSVAVQ